MHSERHAGGVYEIKEGKTIEITLDPCHTDMDYDTRTGTDTISSSGIAPKRFM